jgi:hypothetical protein
MAEALIEFLMVLMVLMVIEFLMVLMKVERTLNDLERTGLKMIDLRMAKVIGILRERTLELK